MPETTQSQDQKTLADVLADGYRHIVLSPLRYRFGVGGTFWISEFPSIPGQPRDHMNAQGFYVDFTQFHEFKYSRDYFAALGRVSLLDPENTVRLEIKDRSKAHIFSVSAATELTYANLLHQPE